MATLDQLQADLDRLNATIALIEQSATAEHWQDGDRHRAPELKALYAERRELRREIESLEGARVTTSRIKVI